MSGRPRAVVLVAAALAFGAAAEPAAAEAATSRVVQDGRSEGGPRWAQSARVEGRRLIVELALPLASGEDVGGGMSIPLTARRLPLRLGQGSDIGPGHEYVVDGVAGAHVRRLRFALQDGTTRSVLARRAPLRLRRRYPGLGRARFFVGFFAPAARPTRVTAFDAEGRRVGGSSLFADPAAPPPA